MEEKTHAIADVANAQVTTDSTVFVAALQPFLDALDGLVGAGFGTRLDGRRGETTPSMESSAMRELSMQTEWAGEWDEAPIDTTISLLTLLMLAAEDAILSFRTLVSATRTPLYGHLAVARAGLELLGLVFWLASTEITGKERVRRCINERIASAYEQSRLPEAANPEPERQTRLLAAQALGFKVVSQNRWYKVLQPRRPTTTRQIQRVLGTEAGGQLLYSYTSATSHGVMWGLVESVDGTSAVRDGPVGVAPLVVSSEKITTIGTGLVVAFVRSCSELLAYLGWTDNPWTDAVGQALEVGADRSDPSARQSSNDDPTSILLPKLGLWLPSR